MIHFNKEHPGLVESIIHDQSLEGDFQEAIKRAQEIATFIPLSPSKTVARKSTGTSSALQKPIEEFSYYGLEVEHVDLNNIRTSMEINGKHVEMSAQELGNYMNLQPYVHVEDCNLSMDVSDVFLS